MTVGRQIKKVAQERENRYQQDTQIRYEVNQKILVKEHPLSSSYNHTIKKFFPKYKGPYTIYKIINDSVVYAQSPTKRIVQNVSIIRPFKIL